MVVIEVLEEPSSDVKSVSCGESTTCVVFLFTQGNDRGNRSSTVWSVRQRATYENYRKSRGC